MRFFLVDEPSTGDLAVYRSATHHGLDHPGPLMKHGLVTAARPTTPTGSSVGRDHVETSVSKAITSTATVAAQDINWTNTIILRDTGLTPMNPRQSKIATMLLIPR